MLGGCCLSDAKVSMSYPPYTHASIAHSRRDLMDTLTRTGNFTRFLTAVEATGLAELLRGPGPLTIFAPNDDAFRKMAQDTWPRLMRLDHRAELTELVQSHLVPRKLLLRNLKGKRLQLQSLSGRGLAFDARQGAMVDRARVLSSDIEASNGVVQVINAVLMRLARVPAAVPAAVASLPDPA
jgi:uncharacterized surface protein with fasciclin (FAS1) repeats